MKKMLILGSTGFIGKACVEYFTKKGKYEIATVDGDLRDESFVKRVMEGQDIVLQMAATTTGSKDVIQRPWLHVTDNAVMNSWIMREAHLQGVEHVIFPSCTVMYPHGEDLKKETDWDIQPDSPYFGVANMKVYVESLCEFYSKLGSTKYTAIRHSNVYGPGDKFDFDRCHMVPAMVRKVEEANKEIEVWGSGKAKRDVLFIDDLLDMFDKVIDKQTEPYRLYNCGAGTAVSIPHIISTIAKAAKKDISLVYDTTKPDIPTTTVLDCSKALDELDWSSTTSLEDGLEATLDWYTRNK